MDPFRGGVNHGGEGACSGEAAGPMTATVRTATLPRIPMELISPEVHRAPDHPPAQAAVDHFSEIVGQHIGSHTYRDTGSTIDQQIW